MPEVEIRWRPSGGRGEYEHVPQDILLGRHIVVNAISVPNAFITTDVWGRIKDGKPRIRRENPDDRSILNIAPLVTALALLPNPRREDKGALVLPLRNKGYVVSAIRFSVEHADDHRAICTPLQLRVLHDNDGIDLVERLMNIGTMLADPALPPPIKVLADHYRALVFKGVSDAELRTVADKLITALKADSLIAEKIEAPSEKFVASAPPDEVPNFTLGELTAKETERRLVSHYRIERSDKIRNAKVKLFTEKHGEALCENCTFSFGAKYGERGKGFIEVHHIQPLAALLPNTITKLSDLLLLCSNCHRMVHRKRPPLTPGGLKEITVFPGKGT